MNLNSLKNVDYKGIALKHAEKAGIALAAFLFVLFLFSGIKTARSAAKIEPEDFTKLAQAVDSSVRNSVWNDSVAQREQVTNPDFSGAVAKLDSAVDVAPFRWQRNWREFLEFDRVLRGQPKILTPDRLLAWAGRGAVVMHEFDSEGNLVMEDRKPPTKRKKAETAKADDERGKKKKDKGPSEKMKGRMGMGMAGGRSGRMGMNSSMMMNMGDMMGQGGYGDEGGESGGFMPGMAGGLAGGLSVGGDEGEEADEEPPANMSPMRQNFIRRGDYGRNEDRRSGRYEEEQKAEEKQEPGKEESSEAKLPGQVPKEVVRGQRWVAVTAIFPNGDQRKEYDEALHAKEYGVSEHPWYRRVEAERRELQSDKTFSEWSPIDTEKMFKEVTERLPRRWEQEDSGLVAARALFLDSLVMRLPELVAGAWWLVDRDEAKEAAKNAATGPVARGGMPGLSSSEGESRTDEEVQDRFNQGIFGEGPGSVGGPARGQQQMPFMRGQGARGQMPGMPGTRGGMQPTASQGTQPKAAAGDAKKTGPAPKAKRLAQTTNAEAVLVRFLDYTVQPEHTYQYRLRVVVANPNGPLVVPPVGRLDVADEAFAKPENLVGDWSEPTPPVYVPGDVEYFVLDRAKNREEAKVQVHVWLADLGDWQYDDFTVRLGDHIGTDAKDHPVVDFNDNLVKQPVPFSTHELMLDITGGEKWYVVDGQTYYQKIPAEVVVVDRLGDLAAHNEELGKNNEDRKAREQHLDKLLKDAREREKDEKEQAKGPEAGGAGDFSDRVPTRREDRDKE